MLITLICFVIVIAQTCDLTVHLEPQSEIPVHAQFTFHNGTNSEIMLHITDIICNLKPTILKTYNEHPGPGVVPIGETFAFLEGAGNLSYLVR
ncbi:unnamed protein product [Strongylus vulgaris]|uniref:Uncharacterized protein n=1 Tax=Strongylus vulgaris TaxID=40348 RepID=A0A3P7IH48_STRVU|nr:unnamed protein product [Strongylus vulgaris]